ncbi:hypothetical protein [Isorropodon fossajaponicum symbiont]|nr:hypothetical protein [Isorropodon fossajaponicum symbiont]
MEIIILINTKQNKTLIKQHLDTLLDKDERLFKTSPHFEKIIVNFLSLH